jgi:hypothetical protein
MKKLILSFVSVLSAIILFAQQSETAKTVKQFYTEMGGAGILFSANFDSRFVKDKQVGWGARIGLGFTIKDNEEYIDQNGNVNYRFRTIGTFPIGFNYLFGKETSPHTFETGAGITILSSKTEMLNYEGHQKAGNLMGFFSFMYRRQPINGGFTWRMGFTPLINTAGDIVPFGAAGLGYSFK